MDKDLRLSAPWLTYTNEVKALFGEDPDIKIVYSDDEPTLILMINGEEKAEAIAKLLPTEKVFGNVILKINVVPANVDNGSPEQLFRKAFDKNPVLSYIKTIGDSAIFGGACYVVFKKKVVQFYNDNIADVNGNKNTLLQDIAGEVLTKQNGVFYCTDVAD